MWFTKWKGKYKHIYLLLLQKPQVIRFNPHRYLISFYHRGGLFLSLCGDGAVNEHAALRADRAVLI